ncbi:MAG: small multi-drug export protein, partial [Spirochaetales bacterium]|nr:small multi-drug export protein [Spirochaetales bacterium]
LGLALFVAVPLPITGAYTGTLGAWVLGMDPKKTFLAVFLGVIISATVVTIVSYLGIEALSFFTKQVHA